MSTRVGDQVETWDEQSFSGGYRELQTLAEADFSGVIRVGGAQLYMTRGVPVGVEGGGIEEFEDGTGTAYTAPHDALPLLAVMQERSDEVRAKYYTEKTSLSKVDGTLSDGGFTGFVELSENVLSGDYYLVYHAGTSMSVAYVGNSGRLITDEEAFETANDEVGIYEVRPVDIEPIDIPDTEPKSEPEPDGESETEQPSQPEREQEPNSESEPDQASKPTSETDQDPKPGVESEPDPPPESEAEKDAKSGPESERGGVSNRERKPASDSESASDPESASAGTGASETPPAQDTGAAEDSATGSRTTTSESRSSRAESETNGATDGTATEPRQSGANEETRGRTGSDPETRKQTRSVPDTSQSSPEETGSNRPQRTAKNQPTNSAEADSSVADSRSETPPGRRQPRGGSSRKQERSSEPRSGAERPSDNRQRQRTPTDSGDVRSADLELKAIPSLDPDRTAIPERTSSQPDIPQPEPEDTGSAKPETQRGASEQTRRQTPNGNEEGPVPPADQQSTPPPATSEEAPAQNGVPQERVTELQETIEAKDREIEELSEKLDVARTERESLEDDIEQLRSEREELEAEREELEAEIQRLESELDSLEEQLGSAARAEQRITPSEALAGTDIFVRYASKGKATLEKAHGGSTRKEKVQENIRLEKHTQFDAANVAVGAQSYEEFLEDTLEFQFITWVIQDLLFEIRDTGHQKALRDLYDVLPQIDRAEIGGVIDVTYREDGQETQSQESFDVVLRNRMGHPLLAANLNDSREATTESMMERLITSAERVGQSSSEFSGAFLVTESFFDPGALEIASQATQGGLLSRDKRKSFVNLSRKSGYHLCLVEARNENFNLAVPEL